MRAYFPWSTRSALAFLSFVKALRRGTLAWLAVGFRAPWAVAGPYAPAAGQPGSDAIVASDPRIVEWASGVANLTRGPQSIANPGGALASFGTAAAALGKADNSLVSLGDGGSITVTFNEPIRDGSGADFAVYENEFASGALYFLELGFVEVSSDGTNFFRFPSVSLTSTTTQTGSFGLTDPTNLYDLAGKYATLRGTPFDLSELAGVSPLLNVNDVRFVRVVDVVGSINPAFATTDSQGHVVNDPWPTSGASSGFDFDAVGVLNAVPEPGAVVLAATGALLLATWGKYRRRVRKPLGSD